MVDKPKTNEENMEKDIFSMKIVTKYFFELGISEIKKKKDELDKIVSDYVIKEKRGELLRSIKGSEGMKDNYRETKTFQYWLYEGALLEKTEYEYSPSIIAKIISSKNTGQKILNELKDRMKEYIEFIENYKFDEY